MLQQESIWFLNVSFFAIMYKRVPASLAASPMPRAAEVAEVAIVIAARVAARVAASPMARAQPPILARGLAGSPGPRTW